MSNKQSLDEFCNEIDSNLWVEAETVAQEIKQHGWRILEPLHLDLGGGGCYSLLYFLTRLMQPSVIVETGVASGYSSMAILRAVDENGIGHLYSSDFPYLRLKNPEKYIGIIVPEKLKKFWSLYTRGDRISLPEIIDQISQVDLFHYDSDKTYEGRTYAYETLKSKLTRNSIVIFDDIQDNCHFKEMVEKLDKFSSWKVFEFQGKYLGLLYNENTFFN